MRFIVLILLLMTLIHTTSAEEITTGNLLPNAGDGVDWGSSSTEQINPGSSGWVSNGDVVNGFTITCPTSQANCGYKFSVGGDFEVTGTATVAVDDVSLTNAFLTRDLDFETSFTYAYSKIVGLQAGGPYQLKQGLSLRDCHSRNKE